MTDAKERFESAVKEYKAQKDTLPDALNRLKEGGGDNASLLRIPVPHTDFNADLILQRVSGFFRKLGWIDQALVRALSDFHVTVPVDDEDYEGLLRFIDEIIQTQRDIIRQIEAFKGPVRFDKEAFTLSDGNTAPYDLATPLATLDRCAGKGIVLAEAVHAKSAQKS